MANTRNHAYLSDQKVLNLTIGLCSTLKTASDADEIAGILLKLLSPQELRMLVIRLWIQKMLLEGATYAQIKKELKVSSGTISRAKLLLEENGVRPVRAAEASEDAASVENLFTREERPRRMSGMHGPLYKYTSVTLWPVQFLGALIKALTEKSRSP